MRVSTRRMRMALRVFADYLDPDVLRPVLKGLRRTGRTLGAVRDLDVFNEKTQVYLDGLPDERAGDLDGLLEAWKAERDKQREHLVTYLDGKRYRRFVAAHHRAPRRPGRGAGAAEHRHAAPAAGGPGAARRPLQGHGRRLGVRGPARRARDAAPALPRAAQGVQGPALHARVLRGRARPGRATADQARQGSAGPPRRPAGRGRHQRRAARLHHVGHLAARGSRPAGSPRGDRRAGRRPLPVRPPGGDGAPGPHLPGDVADGRRQRVQPRPRRR